MAKRVALITGGMGGLGETISTKMADAGYTVAVTYSPSNKSSGMWLNDMKGRGYDFKAHPCDVASYESCEACCKAVVADLGPIDILVNNAGIGKIGPVELAPLSTFRDGLLPLLQLLHALTLVQ